MLLELILMLDMAAKMPWADMKMCLFFPDKQLTDPQELPNSEESNSQCAC